jgi:cytochrome c-type biogenesis protein CcmH
MIRFVFAFFLLAAPAFAISDPAEALPDSAMEARAVEIGRHLRCLVCQNESIEDSGADLARDLRKIVRTRLAAGQTEAEITQWLVSRYGEFVKLRPPVNAGTLVLWGSPLLCLLVGFWIVRTTLRRKAAPPAPLTAAERQRLEGLTKT